MNSVQVWWQSVDKVLNELWQWMREKQGDKCLLGHGNADDQSSHPGRRRNH